MEWPLFSEEWPILILSSGVLKQNFIPDIWQMVFDNVPVRRWIINPYVN